MMLTKLRAQLVAEFPEYVELDNLLGLAAITWRKYGISAGELSQMGDVEREMLWLKLTEG